MVLLTMEQSARANTFIISWHVVMMKSVKTIAIVRPMESSGMIPYTDGVLRRDFLWTSFSAVIAVVMNELVTMLRSKDNQAMVDFCPLRIAIV